MCYIIAAATILFLALSHMFEETCSERQWKKKRRFADRAEKQGMHVQAKATYVHRFQQGDSRRYYYSVIYEYDIGKKHYRKKKRFLNNPPRSIIVYYDGRKRTYGYELMDDYYRHSSPLKMTIDIMQALCIIALIADTLYVMLFRFGLLG